MAWNTAMGSVDILQSEHDEHILGLVSPGLSNSKDRRRNKRPAQQYLAKDDLDDDDLSDELSNPGEKRRRLTVDQVNFLEMSFNMDLKLEPERKAQIAKQLGIRPRQVAIWFQNRRARWKNKQLENEYETLKLKYEAVLKDKETLTKETEDVAEENKKLKAEVSRLNALLCSTENPNMPVSEATMVKEEQLSVKSELTSPTKSIEDQSEVQDSGQSYPTSEDGAVANGSPTTTDDDMNDVMACTVKLEGEDVPLLPPGDDIFGTLPYLFHQFAAANGICVEDAYNFYCEDQFGGLTSWYG